MAQTTAPEKVEAPSEGIDYLIDRAVATRDEHAIKFTEACLREQRAQSKTGVSVRRGGRHRATRPQTLASRTHDQPAHYKDNKDNPIEHHVVTVWAAAGVQEYS
jgi:hypothetical protein